MEVKIVENKGYSEILKEEVLLVSFNDSNYTLMTKGFLERFNSGLITLYIDPKKGFIFKDNTTNTILSEKMGVYR